ncbi:glutamate/sodium ion symporter GltS [Lentibacillus kapialis]|uniref:Glutamate/sodium ion symporter GltS n=2 Tax=Lentibacillus kapialis TaxID=340214 RepID=A0A917Q1N6_9BACI|nr:glutamate/sodium ion symporter GltS [Lentibacillus kapialis]
MLGNWARDKYQFFWKFSIPAPVIGGFGFAIIMLILRETNLMVFEFDDTLYDLFMYIFFVTIGLTTGLNLLKKGGKLLLLYVLVCWLLVIVQNSVGVGVALLTETSPLTGIMAGYASLQGGHGMAGSLSPVVESLGENNALTVGMAAATYGLIAGALIGGPVGNWLIKKNNLKIETDTMESNYMEELSQEIKDDKKDKLTSQHLFVSGAIIFIILAIGMPTAEWITNITGFSVPGHIFSLFLGIFFRSVNDKKQIVKMSDKSMDMISTISLNMFLVMAMMKLKIWELYDLAIPLTIILIIQTIVTVLIAMFIMFKLMGRNYDAAILASGFIGHGLGATPNGLVVMDAVCKKYGVFSKKAFLIIPVAGTVLTDVVGVPVFLFVANLFA